MAAEFLPSSPASQLRGSRGSAGRSRASMRARRSATAAASFAAPSSSSKSVESVAAGGADAEAAADAQDSVLKATQALALVKGICARLRLPINEAEEAIEASKAGGKKRARDEAASSSQQESSAGHFDDPRQPASPLGSSNKKRAGASGSWTSPVATAEAKPNEGSKGAAVSDDEEEVVLESGSAVYGGGGGAMLKRGPMQASVATSIPTRSARVPQNASDGAEDDARYAEIQELQDSVARFISEFEDSPEALRACMVVCSWLTSLSKVSELAGTVAASSHSRSVAAMLEHALTADKHSPVGLTSSYADDESIDATHPAFSSEVMIRVLSLLQQWLDSDGSGGEELVKVASKVHAGVASAI